MCGLAGALSLSVNQKGVQVFQDLMMVSTLRGWQGAGLLAISPKKFQTTILRTELTGMDLALSKNFGKLDDSGYKCVWMGHARFPTKGEISMKDTHPHVIGHIMGVHNGTMSKVDDNFLVKGENDSRLLFETIASKGIQETLNKSSGAYALVWYDSKECTLNFLRNFDRPLYYAQAEGWQGHETLFWASERQFLEMALGRRGFKTNIAQLKENLLVTYRLKDLKHELPKPELTEMKPKYTTYTGGYGGTSHAARFFGGLEEYGDGDSFDWAAYDANRAKKIEEDKKRREEKIPKDKQLVGFIDRMFPKPHISDNSHVNMKQTKLNRWYPKETWKSFLQAGCAACNKSASEKDADEQDIFWLSDTEYVCLECRTDPKSNLPAVIH